MGSLFPESWSGFESAVATDLGYLLFGPGPLLLLDLRNSRVEYIFDSSFSADGSLGCCCSLILFCEVLVGFSCLEFFQDLGFFSYSSGLFSVSS